MKNSFWKEIIIAYNKCFNLLGKSKKRYLLSSLCSVIINICDILEAIVFAELVQSLIGEQSDKFILTMEIAFAIGIISIVLSILSAKLDMDVRVNVLTDIKSICTKVFFRRNQKGNNFSIGEMYSIVQDDTEAIIAYSYKLISYLTNIVVLISVCILLLKISRLWTLLFIFLQIFVGFIQKRGAIGVRQRVKKCLSCENTYQKYLNEELNSLHAIRFQNIGNEIIKFNYSKLKNIRDAQLQNRKYLLKISTSSKLIMYIGKMLIFALMGNQILIGNLSVKEFLVFYSYMGIFTTNYMSVITMLTALQPLLVNVNRICMVIEKCGEINTDNKRNLVCESIEYKKIFKRYGTNEIFADLNIYLDMSKSYTIIGKNGAGKTTFLRLILGEEEASEGEVLINGKLLDEYARHEYQEKICYYAPQPFVLSGMTIMENIMLGIKVKSNCEEKIVEICKDFLLWEDILKFEKKLDSVVGDEVKLSSGQIKKIELIRAALNESCILLMDEPMTNLDNEMKNKFKYLFNKYFSERSVFVVEHEYNRGVYTDSILNVADKKLYLRKNKYDKKLYK